MQLAALILPAWPYALNAYPDRPIARTEIVDLARNVINDTQALRAALRNSCDVLSKTIPDALAADGNDVCHAMTALLSFVAGGSNRVDVIVAEAVALLNRIHAVLESIRQFYRNPQEKAKIRAGGGDALVTGLLHLGGLGAAVSYVRTLHESFDAKRAAAASVRCWLAPMAQDEFLVEYLRRHVERVVRPPLTWQQQLMWHGVAAYARLHGEAVPFELRTNCLRFGPVLSMQEAALQYYDKPHEQCAWSSQLPSSAVAPDVAALVRARCGYVASQDAGGGASSRTLPAWHAHGGGAFGAVRVRQPRNQKGWYSAMDAGTNSFSARRRGRRFNH
jgi:hypothetical protein